MPGFLRGHHSRNGREFAGTVESYGPRAKQKNLSHSRVFVNHQFGDSYLTVWGIALDGEFS